MTFCLGLLIIFSKRRYRRDMKIKSYFYLIPKCLLIRTRVSGALFIQRCFPAKKCTAINNVITKSWSHVTFLLPDWLKPNRYLHIIHGFLNPAEEKNPLPKASWSWLGIWYPLCWKSCRSHFKNTSWIRGSRIILKDKKGIDTATYPLHSNFQPH